MSLIYDSLDLDILNFINPAKNQHLIPTKNQLPVRGTKSNTISHIVVFDNCLTNEFIQKQQFQQFLENCKKNNVYVIIMTHDIDVICSDLSSKFYFTLLHSLTPDWNFRVSADIIKKHKSLINDITMINRLTECVKNKNCLGFSVKEPDTLFQF